MGYNRAGPLGVAKPTILPGVGVALAARGSCSYRGWYIYFFFLIFYKKVTGAYVWRYYSYTKIKSKLLYYWHLELRMVLGTTRAIKASSAPQKHQLEALLSRGLLRALAWLTTATAVA